MPPRSLGVDGRRVRALSVHQIQKVRTPCRPGQSASLQIVSPLAFNYVEPRREPRRERRSRTNLTSLT
eukprot:1817235-Prymnesium_polylepis.1